MARACLLMQPTRKDANLHLYVVGRAASGAAPLLTAPPVGACPSERETGPAATGTLLIDARKAFAEYRGAWGRLIGDHGKPSMLPFGSHTAYRLIAVAKDKRLLAHAPVMPPSWMTLYAVHAGAVFRAFGTQTHGSALPPSWCTLYAARRSITSAVRCLASAPMCSPAGIAASAARTAMHNRRARCPPDCR